MAFDAFLVFKKAGPNAIDIKGETQDDVMKKEGAFEIASFSFGVENTVNITSANSGGGAGKVTFNEFTVEKQTDTGSAGLFHTCCAGGHYVDVELVLRRAGGAKDSTGKPFLVYKFKLVMVKKIDWAGAGGDDVPKETVVFEYGAIRIEYTPQMADGKDGKTVDKEWSRVKNKAAFAVE